MSSYKDHVNKQINLDNGWYVSSQFEWASLPYIKKIYQARFKFILNEIQRLLKIKKNATKLIDLGCGDGYWLKQLENKRISHLNLEGIDYNEIRIKRAKKILSPEIKLHINDLNSYQPTEKFDIVLCTHVIEHIPDDTAFLKSIKKILKTKGILILATPNEGSFLEQRRNKKYKLFDTTDHVHFYTEELIKSRLRKTGYKIIRIYRDPVYIGNDKIFYKFLTLPFGFQLLSKLNNLFPALCSGYIFSCRIK